MPADATTTEPLRDVVVIGGGPAGLAAATWLGRYRRDVVVLDSGHYRAQSVEASHGYLGRDPQHPMDLLATAREQAGRYETVHFVAGEAVRATRQQAGGFEVETADGNCWRALRIILATGVADRHPDVEGFDTHYGASAFHCPACDGYDVRDGDVVAYGWDERLVGFASSLLTWARSVTVLTGGRRFAGDEACRAVLDRHDIPVIEAPAARLLGERGALTGVELADGRTLPARWFFFSVAHDPRIDLARQLGCRVDDEGYVAIDHSGNTNVPGVYAAGDVAPGLQLVQVAAAQGCAAGVAAALSLLGEPGSPLSPDPAPDATAEVADVRG